MARVSVILCSYNQLAYVRASVESVLAQTYDDYELIAVDNGSTDGSRELLAEYAEHPKVRLVLNEQNAPISRRFNEAIAMAAGELIGFLYSDDLLMPRKLELQVAELDRLGPSYGVVGARAERFSDRTGARWSDTAFEGSGSVLGELLGSGGGVDMLSPLTRRACFLRYPFYEDIFAEGEFAFMKIAMTYRFGFVPETLVLLRDHEGNRGRATRRNAEMTLDSLNRLVNHPDFPSEHREAARRFRRFVLRTSGWSVVRLDGDQAWARQCFRDAVKVDWRELGNLRTVFGYALSHAPARARATMNVIGHRLKGNQANTTVVTGYGGADETRSS